MVVPGLTLSTLLNTTISGMSRAPHVSHYFADSLKLCSGIRMGRIDDMNNHVGTRDLFQSGAKCFHELVRKRSDESNRVG